MKGSDEPDYCSVIGYHLYGIRVLTDLINNEGWEASPFFPRVTLCDFRVSGVVFSPQSTAIID